MTEDLMVSGLGGEQLILGMPWLRHYNLQINWRNGEIRFPSRRKLDIRRFKGILDHTPAEILIRAKTSVSQTLEHNQKTGEKKPIKELIPDFLIEYKQQFEKHVSERFPESRPYDHAIDLKPGIDILNCKVYPLSPIEQQLQNEFLTNNLRKGYIRPSKSPMASPFFFVLKKEKGAFRPCQDYQELNKATIKNTYPLPLVSDLIDKLKGARYFTKLDLRNGYNNIRIKDGDQWKAAFKTNKGLFEPMVMFFGLSNSPATFQSFMDDIFADYIEEGWIVIYMDDILIFSSDMETHRKRTIQVLERLKLHDLFLKPEKCRFNVTEIDFLGMIIRPGYIGMDPVKLAGIRDWKPPTTVRGVRSFLGFGNFYRKFIGRFSELARPLNNLTKKDNKFEWTHECQVAFDALKRKFLSEPVLIMPDTEKPFLIECDASKWATGAVLRQQGTDGKWHPCGYISHSLTPTERNYEIYD
ncbi:reverse transcriptase-rnase h-integrase [Moniliophthora roreri MCA 2997]|uniref:Reverse transcriptase-rnase h-integrase n=1 Tax=Moniliophthora roreri (strain MCA 2997) TaxID=1381753 RepID=V2WKE1_MONRO|nr:reverse transcriptase-rnase h-integrase [Moniliophthora roreri MCA 2997]